MRLYLLNRVIFLPKSKSSKQTWSSPIQSQSCQKFTLPSGWMQQNPNLSYIHIKKEKLTCNFCGWKVLLYRLKGIGFKRRLANRSRIRSRKSEIRVRWWSIRVVHIITRLLPNNVSRRWSRCWWRTYNHLQLWKLLWHAK